MIELIDGPARDTDAELVRSRADFIRVGKKCAQPAMGIRMLADIGDKFLLFRDRLEVAVLPAPRRVMTHLTK